jgi:hypothetical protein
MEIFKDWPRFDGAATWASLAPAQQAEIGAIGLEFIVNANGEDAYFTGLEANAEARPFIADQPPLIDKLMTVVQDAIIEKVPALGDDALPVPIPSLLVPVCWRCGCAQEDACEGGCGWAESNLCSACVNASRGRQR